MNVNNSQKGFTLVEVLAVIFVITVGITGVFSLIQTTASSSRLVSNQLTAIYLAQEGVELVRAVRDTNWLEGRMGEDNAWDEGINSGEYQFDYTQLEKDPELTAYQDDRYLKLDGEGYNYSTGEDTRFNRKIILDKEGDEIEVTVEVTFDFQGDTHTVNSQEILYKWK